MSSGQRQHDFIVIGGGSAGSALANRLSADATNQVLVLEAGRPDYIWDVFIHMPAALTFPIGSRLYDWKYESEPEPGMGGRRIYHARGKVLGGSSSMTNGVPAAVSRDAPRRMWPSCPWASIHSSATRSGSKTFRPARPSRLNWGTVTAW